MSSEKSSPIHSADGNYYCTLVTSTDKIAAVWFKDDPPMMRDDTDAIGRVLECGAMSSKLRPDAEAFFSECRKCRCCRTGPLNWKLYKNDPCVCKPWSIDMVDGRSYPIYSQYCWRYQFHAHHQK